MMTTDAAGASVFDATRPGRYDAAERKQGKRAQRERGCWVYMAAVELEAAGFDPHGPPPFYRCHGYQRSRNAGSVIVSLYRQQ